MKMITYNTKNFRQIEYLKFLPEETRKEIELVSRVLPFKTNNYVTDYLIDWENYANDPVFILNFPNREMLREDDYQRVKWAWENRVPEKEFDVFPYELKGFSRTG